ncbi:glycoside hydrolase family 18 protein [Trichoderma citrinoviride]|uniref:chitinase n=1 Tax=Trichoderma citrinoviride TaxID=58853 RepID=A0A2T4B9U2_9HYPO|nr:glycoside hydrolase family 18 protein [Trichoderma citrinoviride]PTB66103.1 glycoside hydrolase family 18 protein [Trichoderma citrinoviride]
MPWISPGGIAWWFASATAIASFHGVSATANEADAFQSQLNLCPLSCSDKSPDQWSVYSSFERLSQCDQPVLFDLAIHTPINDKTNSVLIRACTTSSVDGVSQHESGAAKQELEVCGGTFVESKVPLIISQNTGNSTTQAGTGVVTILDELKEYARKTVATTGCTKDNNIMLGYFDGAVVAIYAGKALSSATIPSVVDHLLEEYKEQGSVPSGTLAQICDQNSDMDHTAGVAVALEADIGNVQSALLSWNRGECAKDKSGTNSRELVISQIPLPAINAKASNSSSIGTPAGKLQALDSKVDGKYCSMRKIAAGDSCASIAKACKISVTDFLKYNGVKGNGNDWCKKLQAGKNICCSSGASKPLPEANGECFTYAIKAGDDCSAIGMPWNLTPKDIEAFNQKITWGWRGCPNLTVGLKICLSKGSPPMPAPVSNAVCGPQKPGTVKPGQVKDAFELAKLNPCPLNSCCNVWGQCGIDPLFCTKADGPTGNPGTAPAGSNGCISNCGTGIVNNAKSPSGGFQRIGYYEAFNWERPCLHMESKLANTDKYTHMHWAFGDIKSDFSVYINDTHHQWDGFMGLKNVKKIVSFGGWGFSTGVASYDVLRKAMTPENRERFVSNLVAFAKKMGIDGIDIDWEYPGAPDIPGIPKGLPSDGPNYLETLRALRKALPTKYSLSIAVPASYWYLRPFPIREMSESVDYIVYMTYDLHGNGNCLRSHVNQTEVVLALSMITKAGVSASKVVVGESSYGRSFKMAKAGCTGPLCKFTGANGKSEAAAGRCTNARGYLANAEINEIISKSKGHPKTWYDKDSASDYLVYNDVEWVAYMSDKTKESRREKWKGLNFRGTVDWAVDLQEFNVTDTTGPHGGEHNNQTGCINVFDNMIWDWVNPSIEAGIGCTNILQPSPLPTTVTLTAYTTLTLQSGTKLSTTVVSAPFSISEVSYQPFIIHYSDLLSKSDGELVTYNPTPQITPDPITIQIPDGWTVTGGLSPSPGSGPGSRPGSSSGPGKATSTTSDDVAGYLLPITFYPTISYRIPSILTPKPPAPTKLPADDDHPIDTPNPSASSQRPGDGQNSSVSPNPHSNGQNPSNTQKPTGNGPDPSNTNNPPASTKRPGDDQHPTPTPAPSGDIDCKDDSCTRGRDCESDDCLRGGDCEGANCVEGGKCRGKRCISGGNCKGPKCKIGGPCEGEQCEKGGGCAKTLFGDCGSGGCQGARCFPKKDCFGAQCERLTIKPLPNPDPNSTPAIPPKPTCLLDCPKLPDCPDWDPLCNQPCGFNACPAHRRPTGKACTSLQTGRDCTEFVSSTRVKTKPTTSWSTTTRTLCETVVDCEAADVTATTTISTTGTAVAVVTPTLDPFFGVDYANEDMSSIEADQESYFSALETPKTTTTSAEPTSTEIAPTETTTDGPTSTVGPNDLVCGYAFYVAFMRFDITKLVGDWVWDDEGEKLKHELKGCGALTGWEWFKRDDNSREVRFNLPLFLTGGCVESAIKSAGGPKISCISAT